MNIIGKGIMKLSTASGTSTGVIDLKGGKSPPVCGINAMD